MSISEAVKAITDEISIIFRHIVPGVIVLGFAYWSYPKWFVNLCFNNTMHIIVLAVAAIATGNFWYVFHRYSLHNLLDWFCWLARTGKYKTSSWGGYLTWLFQHIEDSYSLPDNKKSYSNLFIFAHHKLSSFLSPQSRWFFFLSFTIIILSLMNTHVLFGLLVFASCWLRWSSTSLVIVLT